MVSQKKDALWEKCCRALNPHKVFILVLCGALVLSPFVVWPYAVVAFEIPRVIFWQYTGMLILAMAVVGQLFAKKLGMVTHLPPPKIWLAVACWLTIVVLSSWYNQTLSSSWLGNFYRLDGIKTLLTLAALSLGLSLSWQTHWQRPVAIAQVTALTGVTLWTLIDTARLWLGEFQLIPTMNGAVGISFGQPNFLAGYLLITLPWLYYCWHDTVSKKLRLLCGSIAMLSAFAIFATHSWASVLGLVLLGGCMVLVRAQKTQWLWLLALVFALLFNGYAYWEGSVTYYPESRARIFYRSFLAIQEKPILGWGWATVGKALAAHPWPTTVLHDVYVDKAHSHVLEMTIATGLSGLCAYAVVLVLIFYVLEKKVSSSKKNNHWYTTLLLIFTLYVFHTQTNVIGIAEEIPFWLIVGWVGYEHVTQ